MAKKKKFKIEDMPITKLRHPERAMPHSPTQALKDLKAARKALADARKNGTVPYETVRKRAGLK